MLWCPVLLLPVHSLPSPLHTSLSSSRQILPRDRIILHTHKRDREKERGRVKGRVGGGLGCSLMMWLCKCQPSMEMRKCATEWARKSYSGGVGHTIWVLILAPYFSRYYLGHHTDRHPQSISFFGTPWNLLPCKFSPTYYISDMTYLSCINLLEDALDRYSTLLGRDRLHALWHINKPHTRPLWAWTSNYGCVFPLLFSNHFHFDTGNKVTSILASGSRADMRKPFPSKRSGSHLQVG